MEKRMLGRTGHASTVAIFGAAALGKIPQAEADSAMDQVIKAGVNQLDVAPSYGEAELRLGPWMARVRDRFYLGCKTLERTKEGAAAELRSSLERLGVDAFDLYQFHAVNEMKELDKITTAGGALEAVLAARDEGLTRHIGITGHGLAAPEIFQEALRRFDFDCIMFPINFILYANREYRRQAEELLDLCHQQQVGSLIIKSVAKQPWPDDWQNHATWYEPFDDHGLIQAGIDFVLSQEVTALCTPSDPVLLPLMLKGCENWAPLTADEQDELIATGEEYRSIFAASGRVGID
ncbi:MAG: aldo/keto reductase [Fidelibacterota bacterium]|nr:MAG: aldo/keto reductase [Candidatus Neomarinimicrobiota bacterium]